MEEENGKPVIRVSGLCKSFGSQTVLDGIDLEVERSETMAVLGRSGTGKSVLLKLLIGLERPDAGKIEIFGREITNLAPDQLNEVRKRAGFLFQNAALYDSLTVAENIAFPLRRHTQMNEIERSARVHKLLARIGMEKDAEKLPADISGGMKKRVGLARALVLDPEIILLDEPTAGLDPITAGEIIDLISRLREERQITSIMVTHDTRNVEALADSVALLDEGNIVVAGALDEVKKSDDPFVRKFLQPVCKE